MHNVLRGRDMICFAQDWTGDPLSKTHVMRRLARDNRVLWVNSIGCRAPTASKADVSRAYRKLANAAQPIEEVEKNIHVLNPLALPIYGQAGQIINRQVLGYQVRRGMKKLGFERPVSFVWNPAAGVVTGDLGEDLVIYYCVDEYTAFAGVTRAKLAALENRVLDRADVVIVSAERLLRTKAKRNGRCFLVRHGVDYDHFRLALDPTTHVPDDIASLPRPILGYFGLIGADWFDVALMEHVARRFPSASIALIGKVTRDVSALAQLPNVHLLGQRPYARLAGYAKAFDVALIPFPINEVTMHANPLKAREYLAAGLPVVATAIPEVEVLGSCRIGHDREEFADAVDEALRDPSSRLARSLAMRHESWDARVDDLRRIVAATCRPAARIVTDVAPIVA
jgi:glycosyltransferase involved in cell wall biosynthesis